MCRSSIVHLMPHTERSTSPTIVTLNVSTRTTTPLEASQTLSERVRIAEHLADAIRHVGAAPRNSRSSYAIVPFEDGGAFTHRLNSLINTPRVSIVPPADEDDGTSVTTS